MSEMQKNIQAVTTVLGAILLVAGFAMFHLALGLIVAGIALLVPALLNKGKQ
jgi:hypothetical protein